MTQLLEQARDGSETAREELLCSIYDELRSRARGYLEKERRDHTLQPTALVHEVYVSLLEGGDLPGKSRGQFLSFVCRAMRHILIDYARSRARIKRGGGVKKVPLHENVAASVGPSVELLGLAEALERLAKIDDRKSRVVELRHFGGLSVEEAAEVLDVSTATVERDWKVARTWLFHELSKGGSGVEGSVS